MYRTYLTLKLAGDTEINGVIYKKLNFKKLIAFGYTDDSDEKNVSAFAYNAFTEGDTVALREENKRVYIYNFHEKKEWLLYDFNLKPGDTLPRTYITKYERPYKIIRAIDSVQLNGRWHKRFEITGGGRSYIIEGIGSQNGLITELYNWSITSFYVFPSMIMLFINMIL